jgi:hypothetical protein
MTGHSWLSAAFESLLICRPAGSGVLLAVKRFDNLG